METMKTIWAGGNRLVVNYPDVFLALSLFTIGRWAVALTIWLFT